jgi:1-deoxy-D-xylulose-5-phosphate synthase
MDTSAQPIVRLREGGDVTILSYGIMIEEALKAADLLAHQGVEAEVVKLNCVSPLDDEMLDGFFDDTKILVVLEDSFVAGCVGQRLAATLAKYSRCPERLILKNLGKTFAPAGSVQQLWQRFGLDAASVAKAVMEVKRHGE